MVSLNYANLQLHYCNFFTLSYIYNIYTVLIMTFGCLLYKKPPDILMNVYFYL